MDRLASHGEGRDGTHDRGGWSLAQAEATNTRVEFFLNGTEPTGSRTPRG